MAVSYIGGLLKRSSVRLLVGAIFCSTAMFATTVSMSLGSNAFPNGETGPYLAKVGGINEFVYCDDDTHIVYPNETWTATVTSLSSLVALGNSKVATESSVMWRGLSGAISLYEQAAWLVNQFSSHPADGNGLQHAIWDLFLQRPGTGSNLDMTTDSYWLKQASLNYTSLTTAQMANILILTPVAGSQSPLSDGLPQEFLMATPEPGTYALFGMGIVLL